MAWAGIPLFGVEAERAGQRGELVEQLVCFLVPPGHGEGLDEPEGAGQEGALAAGKAIASGRVAVDQGTARAKTAGDGVDRAADARGAGRFDVQEGQHKYGGVKIGRAVGADVRSEFGVVSVGGDVYGDGVALVLPSGCLALRGWMRVGDAQRSVEGEPGHEFGVHVVRAFAALFPDAGVGLPPAKRDLVGEPPHGTPRLRIEAMPGGDEQPCGVEHPAVAVELMLVGSTVADAHGTAVSVARPVDQLPLGEDVSAENGEYRGKSGPLEAAGVQKPGHEATGFVGLVEAQKRADADAGISGPSEAVVPIADPAWLLR